MPTLVRGEELTTWLCRNCSPHWGRYAPCGLTIYAFPNRERKIGHRSLQAHYGYNAWNQNTDTVLPSFWNLNFLSFKVNYTVINQSCVIAWLFLDLLNLKNNAYSIYLDHLSNFLIWQLLWLKWLSLLFCCPVFCCRSCTSLEPN